MAGEGLGADDLRTIELDDALEGAAPSHWAARLSARAQWRLALWLMSAAGFFAWMAAASPWIILRVLPFYSSPQPITVSAGDPALIGLARFVSARGFAAAGLTVLLTSAEILGAIGLLVGGALFMALRARLRSTLLIVYVVWLVTQVAQVFLATTLMTSSSFLMAWVGVSRDWKVAAASPGPGLWLSWLTALLGVAGGALARQALRAGALAGPDAPDAASVSVGGWRQTLAARPRVERWGVGVATAGLLLWFCGFFALPWLTQGCTGLHFSLSHFVRGTCAGLDSADALAQSPAFGLLTRAATVVVAHLGVGDAARNTVGALVSPGLVIVPVVALAGWALLALWGDQGGARRYGWVAGWIMGACVVAALAFAGGQTLQVNPIILTFNNRGPWVYGPGLAVTLAGLALAAAGLASALTSALRGGVGGAVQALSFSSSSTSPRPSARSVGEKM